MKKSILIPVIAFAVIMVFMAGCESRVKAKEEENKALARRNIEEAFNQGNLDVIDEIFATDFVEHDPAGPDIQGPEGLKQYFSMTRTAFPDCKITLDDQFAEGDKVVNRFTFTGTHKGEFMGIPPSGVQVTITAIAIDRFAEGKMVEAWCNRDVLGMLQQLGVIPPLGQGEE